MHWSDQLTDRTLVAVDELHRYLRRPVSTAAVCEHLNVRNRVAVAARLTVLRDQAGLLVSVRRGGRTFWSPC